MRVPLLDDQEGSSTVAFFLPVWLFLSFSAPLSIEELLPLLGKAFASPSHQSPLIGLDILRYFYFGLPASSPASPFGWLLSKQEAPPLCTVAPLDAIHQVHYLIYNGPRLKKHLRIPDQESDFNPLLPRSIL